MSALFEPWKGRWPTAAWCLQCTDLKSDGVQFVSDVILNALVRHSVCLIQAKDIKRGPSLVSSY